MVPNNQQPVRRRLSFTEDDDGYSTPRSMPRNREPGNAPLPRVHRVRTSEEPIFVEEEATQSSPRTMSGYPRTGFAVLYEGPATRSHRFHVPARGMAMVITRSRNGTLGIYSVPKRTVYIDEEGTETDESGDSSGDEGNDPEWTV